MKVKAFLGVFLPWLFIKFSTNVFVLFNNNYMDVASDVSAKVVDHKQKKIPDGKVCLGQSSIFAI